MYVVYACTHSSYSTNHGTILLSLSDHHWYLDTEVGNKLLKGRPANPGTVSTVMFRLPRHFHWHDCAAGTLTCTEAAIIAIANRELSFPAAILKGKLKLEGDRSVTTIAHSASSVPHDPLAVHLDFCQAAQSRF